MSEFEETLNELEKSDTTVTRELLEHLSGPTRAECALFAERLRLLSEDRRVELLSAMVRFAERDFELDYDDLYRAGLRDKSATVRRYAIEGLWEDERPDLVRKLIKLLENDPDTQVRAAAATSLGRFLFMAECDEIGVDQGQRIREALEQVIENKEEPVDVIRRAIESIAYINDHAVRQIIDRAYADPQPKMRESAVFAMGRSADRFWAETVLAELHSDVPAMRYEAARASGELRLSGAVNNLVRLIVNDRDGEVQTMAVWALGEIGGKRAREVLEHLLESENEALRMAAQGTLEQLDFADRSLDMMVFDLQDSDHIQVDAEQDDMEQESEYREQFERYVDEDEDDDEWPDEFLELD